MAQLAANIADIQKTITRLLAPPKKDDRKERLDELKPSRVGCGLSIVQWSFPMWAGWGVTLAGEDVDLGDWRDAMPVGFDPHVLDAELEGTDRLVMRSSGWERFTSARIVFDDACRLIQRLNGIMRLFDPDVGSVRAENVYFMDQGGRPHRHLIANSGQMRVRERGDRARFNVQVGEHKPKPEPTPVQRLCANAETNATAADLFSYLSAADNYFDLYKAIEASEQLLGGHNRTVDYMGTDSGRTWKRLREIVNCHRHHPTRKRCIDLMSTQPPFDELRAGLLRLIAQIQLSPPE